MSVSKEEFEKAQAMGCANNAMLLSLILVLKLNGFLHARDIEAFVAASKTALSDMPAQLKPELMRLVDDMKEIVSAA